MNQILDVLPTDKIQVGDGVIVQINQYFQFLGHKPKLAQLMFMVLSTALRTANHKEDREYKSVYKTVTITGDNMEIAYPETSIREFFNVADTSSLEDIHFRNAEMKKTIAIKYAQELVEIARTILVFNDAANNHIHIKPMIECSIDYDLMLLKFTFSVSLLKEIIDQNIAGYGNLLVLPGLILSPRAMLMYAFICRHQKAILDGKWNAYKEYDGHKVEEIIEVLGGYNYKTNRDAVAHIKSIAKDLSRKGPFLVDVETVYAGKSIDKLKFNITPRQIPILEAGVKRGRKSRGKQLPT